MDSSPTLLLLAGFSCTGKSELARTLQSKLPGLWIVWEADRSQPVFPQLEEYQTLENEIKMTKANLRALRAYVDLGFNTVAEIDLWSQDRRAIAHEIIGDLSPLTVELQCDLDELERRERARGTTFLGFARSQTGREWNIPTDLVLDSSKATSSQLADSVATWLANNPLPRGLRQVDGHA